MKTKFFIFGIILVILSTLIACTKSYDFPSPEPIKPEVPEGFIEIGDRTYIKEDESLGVTYTNVVLGRLVLNGCKIVNVTPEFGQVWFTYSETSQVKLD